MSDLQQETYKFYETEEMSAKGGYQQKTIAACNFVVPRSMVETSRTSAFNLESFIMNSSEDDLKAMSPKFADMIAKIETSERLNLIHSSRIKSTIIPLQFYLQRFGYHPFTNVGTHPFKTYLSIYGEIPSQERDKYLEIFNSEDNITGKNIKILIISDVFSAGVTIKHVENLFVTNYHWNSAKTNQIFGRVNRFNTHNTLKREWRFVNIYTYVMYRDKGETADEKLENISTQKDTINGLFLNLIKISSIDIDINKLNDDFLFKNLEPFRVPLDQIDSINPYIYKSIMDDEEIVKNRIIEMNIKKQYTKPITVVHVNKKTNVKQITVCLLVYPIVNNKFYLLDIKYYNYIGYIKTENDRALFDNDHINYFMAELII